MELKADSIRCSKQVLLPLSEQSEPPTSQMFVLPTAMVIRGHWSSLLRFQLRIEVQDEWNAATLRHSSMLDLTLLT